MKEVLEAASTNANQNQSSKVKTAPTTVHYSVHVTTTHRQVHGLLPDQISFRRIPEEEHCSFSAMKAEQRETVPVENNRYPLHGDSVGHGIAQVTLGEVPDHEKTDTAEKSGLEDGQICENDIEANGRNQAALISSDEVIMSDHSINRLKTANGPDIQGNNNDTPRMDDALNLQKPSNDDLPTEIMAADSSPASMSTIGSNSIEIRPLFDRRIRNLNPSPFGRIIFGAHHDYKQALYRIRQKRRRDGLETETHGGVGNVVYSTCMKFQLIGNCTITCFRASNHITMTPEDT